MTMLPQLILPIQSCASTATSTKTRNDNKGIPTPTTTALYCKPEISLLPTKKRPRTSLHKQNADTIDKLSRIRPFDYVKAAFEANGFVDLAAIAEDSDARFLPPTASMLEAYSTSVVKDVRDNNLAGVKKLFENGQFQYGCNACNRFGESILHIACRRGDLDMVKFLVGEAGLSVAEIRDDYHRTPLHDAFWTSTASPDVVDYLLEQPYVTELLLAKDKRGFTPLDYSRAEDRCRWLRFLWERRDLLRPQPTTREKMFDLIENVDAITKEEYITTSPAKRQRIVG